MPIKDVTPSPVVLRSVWDFVSLRREEGRREGRGDPRVRTVWELKTVGGTRRPTPGNDGESLDSRSGRSTVTGVPGPVDSLVPTCLPFPSRFLDASTPHPPRTLVVPRGCPGESTRFGVESHRDPGTPVVTHWGPISGPYCPSLWCSRQRRHEDPLRNSQMTVGSYVS